MLRDREGGRENQRTKQKTRARAHTDTNTRVRIRTQSSSFYLMSSDAKEHIRHIYTSINLQTSNNKQNETGDEETE